MDYPGPKYFTALIFSLSTTIGKSGKCKEFHLAETVLGTCCLSRKQVPHDFYGCEASLAPPEYMEGDDCRAPRPHCAMLA